MKLIQSFAIFAMTVLFLLGNVSCITTEKKAKQPPRKKMSSLPQNIPASWEGQGGLPGLGGR